MNHKRHRPKNRRSGCLLCKPHKANGARGLKRREVIKTGFGKIRGYAHQQQDLNQVDNAAPLPPIDVTTVPF